MLLRGDCSGSGVLGVGAFVLEEVFDVSFEEVRVRVHAKVRVDVS